MLSSRPATGFKAARERGLVVFSGAGKLRLWILYHIVVAVTICFHVLWMVDFRCFYFFFIFVLTIIVGAGCCNLSVTAVCQFLVLKLMMMTMMSRLETTRSPLETRFLEVSVLTACLLRLMQECNVRWLNGYTVIWNRILMWMDVSVLGSAAESIRMNWKSQPAPSERCCSRFWQ